MRLPTIAYTTVVGLALAAPGCKKNEKAEPSSPAADTRPAGDTRPADGTKPADDEPAGDDTGLKVRPPTAEDLVTYTADLTGDGPLVATIKTSLGEINCTLAEKDAPLTVANFVGLARGLHPFTNPNTGKPEKRPFYDGLVFHRVMPDFMIQGGDMQGTGGGDPGYEFATEVSDKLKHDKAGTLSMANAGPNTNGSQFFITDKPTPKLDGGYNVFGYCAETDVIKKVARVETDFNEGGEKSKPKDAPKIESITIARKAK